MWGKDQSRGKKEEREGEKRDWKTMCVVGGDDCKILPTTDPMRKELMQFPSCQKNAN